MVYVLHDRSPSDSKKQITHEYFFCRPYFGRTVWRLTWPVVPVPLKNEIFVIIIQFPFEAEGTMKWIQLLDKSNRNDRNNSNNLKYRSNSIELEIANGECPLSIPLYAADWLVFLFDWAMIVFNVYDALQWMTLEWSKIGTIQERMRKVSA